MTIEKGAGPQAAGWTRLTRALHWGVAVAVAVEVAAGLIMTGSYAARSAAGQVRHLLSSQIHHTLGLLLIVAVLVRLAARLGRAAPPMPEGVAPWQAHAARLAQAVLYLLLLLIPLSGWAALSALGSGGGYPAPPLWFFGYNGFGPGGLIPHLVRPVPWNAPVLLRYSFFSHGHIWLLWAGAGVLAAHVGAALHHHFVRRDGVLARMWRG